MLLSVTFYGMGDYNGLNIGYNLYALFLYLFQLRHCKVLQSEPLIYAIEFD